MNRIADILRCVFISFEFFFITSIFFLLFRFPHPLVVIDQSIQASSEASKYLPGSVIGLMIFCAKTGTEILLPGNSKDKILVEWPMYEKLEDRVYCGLVYCVLSTMGAIIYLISPLFISRIILITIFLSAASVAFLITAQFYLAKNKIKMLLERHT
ncbi:hypothetical protein [Paraburkholderia sp. DHOC27]|uniref:hypothetical protein n=1 Tax=Paraburkholderia sp. DHOC27 TaxID=2303330 RepID=UPI000E3D37E4|nr:hypothetical protein [Paraburkholderia sp. DHOC27]RFU46939.1 hypothetical protein D0B32_12250 [Paraburkholderia sp. DHOC27]